jgi:hypothetical protein
MTCTRERTSMGRTSRGRAMLVRARPGRQRRRGAQAPFARFDGVA